MARRGKKKTGRPRGAQSLALKTERYVFSKPLVMRDRWRVRVKDRRSGKVKLRTLDAETFEEAHLEVTRMVNEAEASPTSDTAGNPGALALRRVFASWLRTVDARPVTVSGYQQDLGLVARHLGEDGPIDGVTVDDLERLFFQTWKGQSGRSKLKKLAMLRRVWSWALDRYVSENVPARLVVPKSWREDDADAKEETGFACTEDDARELLRACEDDEELWLAVLIAARTGLRMSNIIGYRSAHRRGEGQEWKRPLIWRDVDFAAAEIELGKALLKNKKAIRLPLHDELACYLRRRRDSLKVFDPSAPIVDLTKFELIERFRKRVEAVGLAHEGEVFTFHCLRKSFAAWLEVDHDVPRPIVALLLGHKKRGVTERYSHARRKDSPERAREFLARLPWLTPEPARRKEAAS